MSLAKCRQIRRVGSWIQQSKRKREQKRRVKEVRERERGVKELLEVSFESHTADRQPRAFIFHGKATDRFFEGYQSETSGCERLYLRFKESANLVFPLGIRVLGACYSA